MRRNEESDLCPIGREATWLVKGNEKCFRVQTDLKRSDEKSFSDHAVNEER
jgi:hypothetical protein